MALNYPVGDFLIQIKNAARAHKKEVSLAKTKFIKQVANVLKKEGFLDSVTEDKGLLLLKLAFQRKEPVIMDIKLVSKPGLRVYKGASDLGSKRSASIFLVSTSKGVMSSSEAVKKRLGGEVIAEVL